MPGLLAVGPLLALFGLLLALTLVQSRHPLPGRTWAYLRSLFPSWRFFEDVEPGPELELCVEHGEEAPVWRAALPPPRPARLLLNAPGNLRLAYQSLVEQLTNDLDGIESAIAPELVSYRLVQRLVEGRARDLGLTTAAGSYRFRLRSEDEVVFESESHPLD